MVASPRDSIARCVLCMIKSALGVRTIAGHSKWANRKHRKDRQDAKKGKVFSKMARRITMAARQGGGDPEANSNLRILIDMARAAAVPNDNIERAIKRGTGDLGGEQYEELTYEGYGPGGIALLLDIVTDNRNRTASDVRYIFTKNGGNLGESGCVAWMFRRRGYLSIERPSCPLDEEQLFALALEAGADDFQVEGDSYEIFSEPEDFVAVKEALEGTGIRFSAAELTMVPLEEKRLEGREAQQLLKLVDALEDHDDVQEVYGNFDLPEEVLAES